MFWSHNENPTKEPVESIGDYLREELRLRLRVAADFATLGAYELSDLDEETDEPVVERAVPEAPPKRVLLFAKVAPVCPHSAARVEPPCATDRAKRSAAERRARGRTLRQRGGSVRAPEQPCICAGERGARSLAGPVELFQHLTPGLERPGDRVG